MSPDDDWALGQNEVDVRNEARNPLNDMPIRSSDGGGNREHLSSAKAAAPSCPEVFACRNPEQAWIDESRAEAEREDTDNEERTG